MNIYADFILFDVGRKSVCKEKKEYRWAENRLVCY